MSTILGVSHYMAVSPPVTGGDMLIKIGSHLMSLRYTL